MQCDYCYVLSRNICEKGTSLLMDATIAKSTFDNIVRMAESKGITSVRIIFSGGEPLLNWGVIEKTIKSANRTYKGRVQFRWFLNTNGTLITPQIANVLNHENVEVHVSLDGPDERSNIHRRFKNGAPVFERIISSLDILHQSNCNIQFNACLTPANINSLDKLVDLSGIYGVVAINLTLINQAANHPFQIRIEDAAQKVIEALGYASQRNITISGAWMQAISGDGWIEPSLDTIPYLVVDTSGKVALLPYHDKALGSVGQLEQLLSSPGYHAALSDWRVECSTCKDCELGAVCGCYLKAMEMYHTGGNRGADSSECQFVHSILDRLVGPGLRNKKKGDSLAMALSTQLKVKKIDLVPYIIHQLTGKGIVATQELLELLNCFKEPASSSVLYERYLVSNLRPTIVRLRMLHYLNPVDTDEELNWLENRSNLNDKEKLTTDHFYTYFPLECQVPARQLTDILETAYHLLLSKGFSSFNRKVLIHICRDRSEFKQFWGDAPLPDWPKAFVATGRILVVDAYKLTNLDRNSTGFLKGMVHELLHVFLRQLHCHLPMWFEEGLCEYFSQPFNPVTFKILAESKGIYGIPELSLFSKHSLLDLDDAPVRENICYRQSHAFVAYLVSVFGERKLLEFVWGNELGKDWSELFRRLYGMTLAQCEKAWLKSVGFNEGTGEAYSFVYRKLRASKNLRIVNTGNICLFYNAFNGSSLLATPDLIELMNFFEEGKTINATQELYEIPNMELIISNLFFKGLLVFTHTVEHNLPYRKFSRQHIESGGLVNKLRLNVSNMCNMCCAYCYVEQDPSTIGNMSWEVAEEALRQFFNLLQQHKRDRGTIRFFGGEPLLNWSVVDKVLDYVESNPYGDHVDLILNTNGTIVDEEIAAKVSQHKVIVAISVDGIGEVHDKCRKFCSGAGTFKSVDRGLDIYLAQGCRVGLETTIGEHNIDSLLQLIDYVDTKATIFDQCIHLSLQSICMGFKGEDDEQVVEQWVEKIVAAMNYAKHKRVIVEDGMINYSFKALFSRRATGAYCGAMGGEICVQPNGEVHPCGALKMRLGRVDDMAGVFKSGNYRRMVERVVGNIPECKGCDIEAFCAGGCAADAMNSKGDILASKQNCRFESRMFSALLEERLWAAGSVSYNTT